MSDQSQSKDIRWIQRFDNFKRAYARLSAAAALAKKGRVLALVDSNAAALAEVEEIAATPGLNELFIGPYDLSQALEIPGQVLDEKLLAAGRRVVAAVRAAGIGPLCRPSRIP